MNIKKLVEDYKKYHKDNLVKLLDHYRELEFEQAIEQAALGLNEKEKTHSHQCCISRDAKKKSKKILLSNIDSIRKSKNFEALIKLISEITDPITGLGSLYVYDTSLRIGAKLDLSPEKVYLHSDTSKGYKALMGIKRLENNCRTIEVDKLRDCLKNGELDPCEIEDFLCIYKDCFGKEGNECDLSKLRSCK